MPNQSEVIIAVTGQHGCWDTLGKEVKGLAALGQDGQKQAGTPFPADRFVDNGDGTVSDALTGLVWLKYADFFGEVSWDDALQKSLGLADGSVSGDGKYTLSDGSQKGAWRLPNIREMLSLIDYGSSDPIIPKPNPFDAVQTAIYWTSTTLTPAPYMAWMMTLGIGPTVFDIKNGNRSRMWPVRDGKVNHVAQTGQQACWNSAGALVPSPGTGQDGELQKGVPPPAKRFVVNGDGTVTDSQTGLVWMKDANPFDKSRVWQDAVDLCNSLGSGMYGLTDDSAPGDWRLPNIREAESLVDYGTAAPCLPPGHPFDNVRPSSYWTSTSVTVAPNEAMFIIYGVGPSIFENKEHPFFVWPVRNVSKP